MLTMSTNQTLVRRVLVQSHSQKHATIAAFSLTLFQLDPSPEHLRIIVSLTSALWNGTMVQLYLCFRSIKIETYNNNIPTDANDSVSFG